MAARPGDAVVEQVQNFFRMPAQRVQKRGDRQLALAVDADVDDVLGVEFQIEPRTAIGDHAGGKQILARSMGLAAIMIEEDARRTVHLRNDHALGAVDDEGAVAGHERHVAHVDILLLDIEHGAGFGIGIHFEHDQPQRDAHRRRIGHAALAALVRVVLRLFQLVMHEIQLGSAGEIADREDAAQRLFKAGDIAHRRVGPQELFIAFALHLDEVRHLHDFADMAKVLADAAAVVERLHALGRLHLGGHVFWSPSGQNFASSRQARLEKQQKPHSTPLQRNVARSLAIEAPPPFLRRGPIALRAVSRKAAGRPGIEIPSGDERQIGVLLDLGKGERRVRRHAKGKGAAPAGAAPFLFPAGRAGMKR